MLRMTLIALAAVSALGVSAASAAPFNGYVVGAAMAENGVIQQVQWEVPALPSSVVPTSPSPVVVSRQRQGS